MWQHKHSRVLAALALVLCVAVCSATKPASKTTSFADYLESKKAASLPVLTSGKLQSSMEYVEAEHACLKEVSYKNCRSPYTSDNEVPQWGYFESGVTCCDGRSNSGNSLGSSAIEVGSCKFNEWYFSDSIEEAPGVSKLGEFSVQCYLNSASESCGGPFCDQLVLSAEGGIYYADDVVLASKPITGMVDGSCSGTGKRETRLGSGKVFKGKKKSRTGGGGTVKIASTTDSSVHTGQSLYSGEAYIYFGPMTINSRFHDVKVSQGWFEYVFDYFEGDAISEADAEGKHVVDPYTYDLKFYKSQSY